MSHHNDESVMESNGPVVKDQMHNKSMDKSTVSKSPKQSPKLSVQQARIKNYSNLQRSKLQKKQEPLEIERVIEHNSHLKEQIKELVIHLDDIMKSQQDKKIKEIRELQEIEQNEELLQMKRLLRDQEIEISDNKEQLNKLQRQLQNTYEINHVVEKENLLKQVQKDLDQIVQEEEALQKVKINQKEALNQLNDYEVEKQLTEIKQKLPNAKSTHKALNEELQYSEKVLQKLHAKVFSKQKRAKEIHLKIQAAKKTPQVNITIQDVKELEDEVDELEQEKQNEEKNQRDLVKEMEQYRLAFKIELEKKSLKLVSLEKDLRLNRIIINEQLRLYKIQLTQQMSKERSEMASQMSNYTSKPNLALRHTLQKSREKSPIREQSSEKKSQSNRPSKIYKIQPITELKHERKTTPVITPKKTLSQEKKIEISEIQNQSQKNNLEKNLQTNNDIEEKYDYDFDEEIQVEIQDKKESNDNIEDIKTEPNELNKQEFYQADIQTSKEEQNQIYSKPMLMLKKRK